jgi:subtilase family serine protease
MSSKRCRWAAALGAVCVAGALAAPARADWHAFRGPNAGYDRAVCGSAAPGQARCLAQVETDAAGQAVAAAAPAGYGPAQLRGAYSLPATGGSGQTVAIVDAYNDPNAESDLSTYRSTFGIPACTTANGCFKKVNQNGSTTSLPASDPGWSEEISLDLDMVSAICPSCHILLVEATSPTLANLATAVNRAAAMGAKAISNSYGGSESGSTGYASAYNHAGVAITASAGDNGYGVSFPASATTVTAVGGTSLTLNASNQRSRETVWSGTGSGCSRTYAQAAWQTPLVPAGVCSRRIVGDVSAVADPGTGVAVYDSYQESGWLVFGGTSVSAPIIASVYALAGNESSINAQREPLPYQLGHPGSNLYDVTSGRNGTCGGSYLCTARAGYDGPTGLGTPIGTGAF